MNKPALTSIKKQILFVLLLLASIYSFAASVAVTLESDMMSLSKKQIWIVPISATAASGDLSKLKIAIELGLDNGLTVNEIKDVLTQVYAYAGFPRSLNALSALQQVINERNQSQNTSVGPERDRALSDIDAYAEGKIVQKQLTGKDINMPFSPDIDYYLKAHLFGDIFSSNLLSWQDREVATISMLAAMDGLDSQLLAHINVGKYNGITQQGLVEISRLLTHYVSTASGERLAQKLNL